MVPCENNTMAAPKERINIVLLLVAGGGLAAGKAISGNRLELDFPENAVERVGFRRMENLHSRLHS